MAAAASSFIYLAWFEAIIDDKYLYRSVSKAYLERGLTPLVDDFVTNKLERKIPENALFIKKITCEAFGENIVAKFSLVLNNPCQANYYRGIKEVYQSFLHCSVGRYFAIDDEDGHNEIDDDSDFINKFGIESAQKGFTVYLGDKQILVDDLSKYRVM